MNIGRSCLVVSGLRSSAVTSFKGRASSTSKPTIPRCPISGPGRGGHHRSPVFASRSAYSSRRADRETRDGFHYRTATCLNDRRDANSDAPAARVSVGLHDLRRPLARRRTRHHTWTRDAGGPTRKLPAERLNGPNKDDRGRAERAGIKPVARLYTSRSPVVWGSRIKVASGSSVDSTVPRADQPSVPTIVSTLAVFRTA